MDFSSRFGLTLAPGYSSSKRSGHAWADPARGAPALHRDFFFAYRSRGRDKGVRANVLGQVRAPTRRQAAEIADRAEQPECDDPRVLPLLAMVEGVRVYRRSEAATDTRQPSPLGQLSKESLCARASEKESDNGLLDGGISCDTSIRRVEKSPDSRRSSVRSCERSHHCLFFPQYQGDQAYLTTYCRGKRSGKVKWNGLTGGLRTD